MQLLELPLEILMTFVDVLPPAEYLIIKFVCRTLNQLTKRQDGSSARKLRDLHKHRYEQGPAMAMIEASLSSQIQLDKLTCSDCGKRMGLFDGEEGFDDARFDRHNPTRTCIECDCDLDLIYEVRDDKWIWCSECEDYKPRQKALRIREMAMQFKGQLAISLSRFFEYDLSLHGATWVCKECLQRGISETLDDMDFCSLE